MTLSADRESLIAEARTWLGTPYHPCADVKGVGVDCAMILVRLFAGIGRVPVDLDPRPYSPDWHLHRSEEAYLDWLLKYAAETDAPEPGDVAVWRFGRTYSHGGIIVADGHVLHSLKPIGVVITSMREEPLAGRDARFFSIFGAA